MSRFAVSLELVNLTQTERDLVNTMVALLSDPKLSFHRSQMLAGKMALVVEDGEVTWVDAPQDVPVDVRTEVQP